MDSWTNEFSKAARINVERQNAEQHLFKKNVSSKPEPILWETKMAHSQTTLDFIRLNYAFEKGLHQVFEWESLV